MVRNAFSEFVAFVDDQFRHATRTTTSSSSTSEPPVARARSCTEKRDKIFFGIVCPRSLSNNSSSGSCDNGDDDSNGDGDSDVVIVIVTN